MNTTPNGSLDCHGAHNITGIIRCRTCWSRVELSWSPLGVQFAYCRGIDMFTDDHPISEHTCDPVVVLPTEVSGIPTTTGTDATVNQRHNTWKDQVRAATNNLTA
jgi:hypothetical protein